MPITGLPNPQIHRLCKRCRQWFDHHEVESCWPPKKGLLSFVHVTLAEGLDQFKEQKHYCHACQELNVKDEIRFRKQFTQGLIMFAIVLILIVIAWAVGLEEIIRGFAEGGRR